MKYVEKNKKALSQITRVIAALGLVTGCTSQSDLNDTDVEISGRLAIEGESSPSQKVLNASAKAQASSVGSYDISCVTLSKPARSVRAEVKANGDFKIKVPAEVGVACFVVARGEDEPVATLYVEAEQKTMGMSLSGSLNLSSNVSLGELNLNLNEKEVRIPRGRIAAAETPVSAEKLKLEDLNASTYELSCVQTGNQFIDARCEDQLMDNGTNTVYLRILSALQNEETIQGMGVWESEAAFNNCGGIDLTQDDADRMGTDDGITFPFADKISIGASFNVNEVSCPLRNPNENSNSYMNIRKNYALGGVRAEGDGYTMHSESESWANEFCQQKHKTIVHFRGDAGDKLIGQFYSTERYIETQQGACSHLTDYEDRFIIELNKVQ